METTFSFDWNSIAVPATEVIALMRRYRTDGIAILFRYDEGQYRVGVNPAHGREPFYMEEHSFPSMLAFCSGACVDGGFLLPDLHAPLYLLAINDGDPAVYVTG